MSFSRSTLRRWISCGTLVFVACGVQQALAAEPKSSDAAEVVVSDSADLKVPAGDAATLLKFIEMVANPQQQFNSDQELKKYLDDVSKSINTASDKILAGDAGQATDRQLIDAIEWKMEAQRIRQKLGDADAEKQTDDFLASLKFDDKPAVAKAVDEIRRNYAAMRQQMEFVTKMRRWQLLDAAERTQTTDWLINTVKSGAPTAAHAAMVAMFVNELADTPDSGLAKKALAELLPVLSASGDPGIQDRLPILEGINRRLNLLGNKMEVSGTFLDGTKLDWASYRGKVVLVDYWATWCGPCRAEVPNVLENYLKFHDKGFDVIGISLDETRSDAENYVKQTNIPWPSLFFEGTGDQGWQNPMAVKYGITGIPTAILIDQEGNVVSMEARGPRLGALLQKLLGKATEAESSGVEVSDRPERTAQRDAR